MKHSLIAFLALVFLSSLTLQAQESALSRATDNMLYKVEGQVSTADGQTPLWLTANRYGLSSTDAQNGYLRASLFSSPGWTPVEPKWKIGYGLDVVIPYNYTSKAVVQQCYADVDYRLLRLTVGAKEHPMAFRNNSLSSGSQTLGINARPVPEVRIGLPEYWNITGKGHWAAIRGHISYGMLTDGRFQRDYVAPGERYARKALYHSKAGYLRLGNAEKFPLTFEGGLEMACMFGGTIYNALTWDGVSSEPIHMGTGLKDFVDATLGVGGDSTDSEGYANATGNTLGSWLFRLDYHGKGWGVGVYYDHFFEDHSQMFFEYGWLDGLWGFDLSLPSNRWVSEVTYEYLTTTYQSGPVYHDQTAAVPDQISGVDNYYNHNLYAGWQHWGQAMGNALYVSPLYNRNGSFNFTGNRFRAHHIGVSGNPLMSLGYRLLYSHERNLGTYAAPFDKARTSDSFMAELHFAPRSIGKWVTAGWQAKVAFAIDRGNLLGNNTGFQFTISKTGFLPLRSRARAEDFDKAE